MTRDASRLVADLPLLLIPRKFKFMTNKGDCLFHGSREEDMKDKQIQVARGMKRFASIPRNEPSNCKFRSVVNIHVLYASTKEQIMTTKVYS